MISAEERAAKIIEECGFIKNFLKEMDINDNIKKLEEFARAHRPSTVSKTEPLTKFLSPEQAKRLEELRRYRLMIKQNQEKSIICAKERISKEGITLVKMKKGTFAVEKQPKKKETEKGLAALFDNKSDNKKI